jgi:chromate transport protein ChrA
LFFRQHIILGLIALISAFVFIESGFKRQLPQVFNSVAIGLAVVSALLIVFHFFWPLVIFAVVLAGLYVMWENLRELVHL